MWVGDCETDGLYEECTKIHCAVFYNTDTEEWREFTPDNIAALSGFLSSIKTLCMHNGIGFDLRVFEKLLGITFEGYFIDTLIMCRVLWPDIEPAKYIEYKERVVYDDVEYDDYGDIIDKGVGRIELESIEKSIKGHSVEAWGVRLGIKKPEHEDWSQYSEEMLHRCKEDVKIQTQLYLKCIKTIEDYKRKDSRLNNWKNIFQTEMDFWRGMELQASNGWLLDIDLTYNYIKHLEKEIKLIDDEITVFLPKVIKRPYPKECVAFKQDGCLTLHAKRWLESHPDHKGTICGDFTRIKFEPLNLNSPAQLKDYLFSKGWVPREYNFKKDKHNKPVKDEKGNLILTTPKLPKTPEDWELVANDTNSPELNILANRSKMKHRLGMLTGFYEKVRPDRRIAAKMITCGTPTARATHIDVVNVPKAEDGVYFGKECRSVFTVPEGKVLVGVDASALEARCEAHYLYKIDKASALMLIEGDIHTLNAEVWNVIRRLAKNGKYALTYGCSPKKLAATLFKPPEMAKQLYDDFWNANPALKELVRLLEEQLNARGYLVGIDGRPLFIRYKHARLNTLLQFAGAIAMKKAWCLFDEWRTKEGLQREILDVGNFHDESQMETIPELAETAGQKFVDCIARAGEILRFNIPLTGEYKIGNNWSVTH